MVIDSYMLRGAFYFIKKYDPTASTNYSSTCMRRRRYLVAYPYKMKDTFVHDIALFLGMCANVCREVLFL